MREITRHQRFRYWFHNTLSRGTLPTLGWLMVPPILLVLAVAVAIVILGATSEQGARVGFGEAAWQSLLCSLDGGTVASQRGSPLFLFSMVAVTVGGILVVSIVIGVLSSGIQTRLQELRKGRSLVVEERHTVILGWSPQIYTIVQEIIIANENQPYGCIAILAEKDMAEMEDELRARIEKRGNTRIVCRTGNPIDLTELDIVNPQDARAIIVLAPEGVDNPDAHVIKTIMALTSCRDGRPVGCHIVAAIRDPKNLATARLVGQATTELVTVDSFLSRIMAQTCRQPGLSVVYTELLDFDGDEIYFQHEPALAGKTFGDSLFLYEDSAVIGVRRATGAVLLNPPMDTVLGPDDKIIAVSHDDDTVVLSGKTDFGVDEAAIHLPARRTPQPERTLVLGWNRRAATILSEIDAYVAPDSQVTVVSRLPLDQMRSDCARVTIRNEKLTFREGDPADRATLDSLDVGSYQHVILLGCSILHVQEADARTLITLLHLRDIREKNNYSFLVTTEILDIRNRALAEVTRADDFIVSDKLVSLFLSQLSENHELEPVFEDLLNPEGSETYLKPAGDYVALGAPVSFYTVLEAARRRSEVAIGYRILAEAHDPGRYGVYVNPPKSSPVSFAEGDRIIVLAES